MDMVERAALNARRRLVLGHILSPVNALISKTLEEEAGDRPTPLNVARYLCAHGQPLQDRFNLFFASGGRSGFDSLEPQAQAPD
jgi:hypothetical protein